MLLWRYTSLVKKPCLDEIVALFKSELERTHLKGRVSVPVYLHDTVVLEGEFESLAAYEDFMHSYWAMPETAKSAEVMDRDLAPEGTNEMWEIRLSKPNPQPVTVLERIAVTVKNGKVNELVDVVAAEAEAVNAPMQVLSATFARDNGVDCVFEFAGEDEQHVFWDAFGKREETKLFFEKWDAIVVPGGQSLLLTVK